MVFNGDSSNQDLCSLADAHIGTDDTSFPLQRKALFASTILSRIWRVIFMAYAGWQFVSKEQSSNAYSDVNVTANDRSVSIPTGAQTVIGVARLNTDVTPNEYVPLVAITEEEINRRGYTIDNFEITAGDPHYYLPKGNKIYVFPGFDTTISSGIRIYHDLKTVAFAATGSDTRTPGLIDDLDEGVALGMAWLEARRSDLPQRANLEADFKDYLIQVAAIYRKRFKQQGSQINRGSTTDYASQMI